MRFQGLDPWPENAPVVECCAHGVLRDLHNCTDFQGFQWRSSGELWLSLRYDDRFCGGDSPAVQIGLGFGEVTNLNVKQVGDFDPREGTSLESLWYRADDVEIEAGGLTMSFQAAWAHWSERPADERH